MIELSYELTFWERIEGPLGATSGDPGRTCWTIVEASLTGPRLRASLAAPGADWIRLAADGTRRQDQRTQFLTGDGTLILMRYDTGVIRGNAGFTEAVSCGLPTEFGEHYMYMVPEFEVGGEDYSWLTRHLFIGRGRLRGLQQIEYEIYRLN